MAWFSSFSIFLSLRSLAPFTFSAIQTTFLELIPIIRVLKIPLCFTNLATFEAAFLNFTPHYTTFLFLMSVVLGCLPQFYFQGLFPCLFLSITLPFWGFPSGFFWFFLHSQLCFFIQNWFNLVFNFSCVLSCSEKHC